MVNAGFSRSEILLLQGGNDGQCMGHFGRGEMALGTLQVALGGSIAGLQQGGHAVAEVGALHTGGR